MNVLSLGIGLGYAAALALSLASAARGADLTISCQPVQTAITHPSAAVTRYVLAKNPKDEAEDVDGPTAFGTGPDGTAWFALNLTKAVGRVRGGAVELCGAPLGNVDAKRLYTIVTKSPPPVYPQTLSAAVPAGGSVWAKARAANGDLWFTIDYTGMHGNRAKAGSLGRLDAAHHVTVYHVPGINDANVSIAIAKDGTIFLGDYYREQIFAIDPSKL